MNQNKNQKHTSTNNKQTHREDIDGASFENAVISDSTDSEEDDSESAESSSFCRHCLRPQSELQMHYLRTRQRSKLRQRKNQKQRHDGTQGQTNNSKNNSNAIIGSAKRKRSKQRRTTDLERNRRNNKKPVQNRTATNLPISTLIACDKRTSAAADLNAANAEVIRFRCPQVGPLLGHNVSGGPMHFHHPLHQQQHHYAYQQYQQYQQLLQQQQHINTISTCITMESEKSTEIQQAKRPNCRHKRQQLNTNNTTQQIHTITRGTTLELPLVKTSNEAIVDVAESDDDDSQLEGHEGDEVSHIQQTTEELKIIQK